MKRGLYIGRFQPFHLGHFNTLKEIESEDYIDEMIIAIGSSLTSHTPRNPFTMGERIDMILDTVHRKFDFKTYVFGVSDIEYNAVWVKHMIAQLPKFDVVYANNPHVAQLFREEGFETRNTSMTDRNSYSSTEIRDKINSGDMSWQFKVPPNIWSYIVENRLYERIQAINKTDAAGPAKLPHNQLPKRPFSVSYATDRCEPVKIKQAKPSSAEVRERVYEIIKEYPWCDAGKIWVEIRNQGIEVVRKAAGDLICEGKVVQMRDVYHVADDNIHAILKYITLYPNIHQDVIVDRLWQTHIPTAISMEIEDMVKNDLLIREKGRLKFKVDHDNE